MSVNSGSTNGQVARARPAAQQSAPGRRAAMLAATICQRELGIDYARRAWQALADAARLGLTRRGSEEAWAGGTVLALARADGVLHPGGAFTAEDVANSLGVPIGALTVTEQELTRSLGSQLTPSAR